MSDHGSWRARIAWAQCQRLLAKRVICASRGGNGWIGVTARPRLDARVEIHRASLPAQLDERDARNLDRHVEQEVSTTQQRSQNPAMVLPCQGFLDEFDAVFLCFLSPRVCGRHNRYAIRCNAYVSQEEGQHALPDAAKTDDQY